MSLSRSISRLSTICRKNGIGHSAWSRPLSVSVVCNNPAVDPVQQIFLDQVAKYKQLSQKAGGPVDAGPEYQQKKQDAINRLKKVYSIDDPTKFPEFKFSEPDLNQDDV